MTEGFQNDKNMNVTSTMENGFPPYQLKESARLKVWLGLPHKRVRLINVT